MKTNWLGTSWAVGQYGAAKPFVKWEMKDSSGKGNVFEFEFEKVLPDTLEDFSKDMEKIISSFSAEDYKSGKALKDFFDIKHIMEASVDVYSWVVNNDYDRVMNMLGKIIEDAVPWKFQSDGNAIVAHLVRAMSELSDVLVNRQYNNRTFDENKVKEFSERFTEAVVENLHKVFWKSIVLTGVMTVYRNMNRNEHFNFMEKYVSKYLDVDNLEQDANKEIRLARSKGAVRSATVFNDVPEWEWFREFSGQYVKTVPSALRDVLRKATFIRDLWVKMDYNNVNWEHSLAVRPLINSYFKTLNAYFSVAWDVSRKIYEKIGKEIWKSWHISMRLDQSWLWSFEKMKFLKRFLWPIGFDAVSKRLWAESKKSMKIEWDPDWDN